MSCNTTYINQLGLTGPSDDSEEGVSVIPGSTGGGRRKKRRRRSVPRKLTLRQTSTETDSEADEITFVSSA